MNLYESWEFCKVINCTFTVRPKEQRRVLCGDCGAFKLHQYLKENGQILEEGSELAKLVAENAGLRANSIIQESIINSNSSPSDKEKIVKLILENAALRADNAYIVKYAQALCEKVDIGTTGYMPSQEELDDMLSPNQELKHVLSQSGPGAALLQELKQLRAVRDAAGELKDSYGKDATAKMNAWHNFVDTLVAAKGSGVDG